MSDGMDTVSAGLRHCLHMMKNKIGRHGEDWDSYKTSSSPYEIANAAPPTVVTPEGDPKHPISRAYYKLWEIANDSPAIMSIILDRTPKTFAYIAEAPGSFVEAVVSLRSRDCPGTQDTHVGMTIMTRGKNVPHWKLNWKWMRHYGVRICRGADGSGDICDAVNLADLVETCGGEGSCDMVTADGGFDFSNNFNEQESQMVHLVASECVAALRLLRQGGCCVVKIFDAFKDDTRKVLGGMMSMFDEYDVVKPATSRPANSERYLVCSGYRRPEKEQELKQLAAGKIPACTDPGVFAFVDRKNTEHSVAQLESIISAFDAMECGASRSDDDITSDWMRKYHMH